MTVCLLLLADPHLVKPLHFLTAGVFTPQMIPVQKTARRQNTLPHRTNGLFVASDHQLYILHIIKNKPHEIARP